jgi:hypothetical protein
VALAVLLSWGCSAAKDGKPTSPNTEVPTSPGKGDDAGEKGKSRKPDYSMSAIDLTKEFIANKDDAKRKYEGKLIEVSGKVYGVRGSWGREVGVELEGHKDSKGYRQGVYGVLLPEFHAKGNYLSSGKNVKITGEFSYWDSMSIFVVKCKLEEMEKSDIRSIKAEDLVDEFAKDSKAAEKKYKFFDPVIVFGEVQDCKTDRGFLQIKLKGNGKWWVRVRASEDELIHAKKGRTLGLRGIFAFTAEPNEVFIDGGFIVDAK